MTDLANPAGPGSSAADEEPSDRPSGPPRLEVDPDSPFADVLDIYTSSDRAQLAALETTASLFLAEVIDHLGLINPSPESPYQHASLTDTAIRFATASKEDHEDDNADGDAGSPAEANAESASKPSAESIAEGDSSADPDHRATPPQRPRTRQPCPASPGSGRPRPSTDGSICIPTLRRSASSPPSSEPRPLAPTHTSTTR